MLLYWVIRPNGINMLRLCTIGVCVGKLKSIHSSYIFLSIHPNDFSLLVGGSVKGELSLDRFFLKKDTSDGWMVNHPLSFGDYATCNGFA